MGVAWGMPRARATVQVDEFNLVPVPLGFDMWMHFGDSEFVLTDPVDSTAFIGMIVRRLHDGGCGIMQFDCSSLRPVVPRSRGLGRRSPSSCLRMPPMRAAEQNGKVVSTSRRFTSWFLAGPGGKELR